MGDFVIVDVIVWTLWFMVWLMAFWLFVGVVSDLFRDKELSGWAKAAWTVFLVLLPFLGALVYLVARGRSMGERSVAAARAQDQAVREYVRQAAGAPSAADELAKLADLHQRGVLSQTEYEQAKASVLGGAAPVPGIAGHPQAPQPA
jgi:hypothetical protein